MLKADSKRFENLASTDEAVRTAAAQQLQALDRGHFHHHPPGKFRFSAEQVAALVVAWEATPSELVKVWIAQALALTQTFGPGVPAILVQTVRLDGAYMPNVAGFLHRSHSALPDSKALFRSWLQHPNPGVRLCCADAQQSMAHRGEQDYATDMPILRRLMLDSYHMTRMTAVQAAAMMPGLGPADYEVLLDVVNIDSGAARHYAQELIAKLENTVPGCTRAAFAPREPLLRSDGVYCTDKAELDAEGVWVSSGCLRFFPSGALHYFGTNEHPVDFPQCLPGRTGDIVSGTVSKTGEHVAFTLTSAEGVIDYTGRIDGDKLLLQRQDLRSGRRTEEEYTWMYVDWNAKPREPEAPPKRRSKKVDELPFVPLRPKSMRVADAAKWYIQMVLRLPRLLEEAPDDAARVERAWRIKDQLRANAAEALYDPAIKKELYAKLPIAPLAELQQLEPGAALQTLLTVTLAEYRAFPGTIGEAIGMEYWDGRQTWVMTEEGWALKA